MAVDNFSRQSRLSVESQVVRQLLDDAAWASLGTIDRIDGAPSISLVQIAVSVDGAPILLISELASHTRNLRQDQRASLLIDRRTVGPVSAAVERVTLIGRACPMQSLAERDLFLARHPEAQSYAGFGDFAFWRFEMERILLVAGFGRICELKPSEVLGVALPG